MTAKPEKIIFFGTSEFAVPALEMLAADGYQIAAVITTPDEPAGRKRMFTPPSVKVAAEKLGLNILQFPSLKIENLKSKIPAADAGVVAAYGKIIPKEIIELPKHGILNIHPSLLPKYRGASPIQSAILNGDRETGVTVIKIDEELDHGPIIASGIERIAENDGFKELHDRLSKLGAELLVKILPEYLAGNIKPTPQEHDKATFTRMLKTEDGKISADDTAEAAYDKVRALNPEPGAFIVMGNKRLKILAAEPPLPQKIDTDKTGTLLDLNGKLGLRLKNGVILLKQVQLEGKKPVSGDDFIKGHRNLLFGGR